MHAKVHSLYAEGPDAFVGDEDNGDYYVDRALFMCVVQVQVKSNQ